MKKILSAIGNAIMVAVLVVIGALLAAASFVWYLIPKWQREEKAETDKRVAALKASLADAHAKREAAVVAKVAEIEKKADEAKVQDSVDLANEIIKG